MKCLPLLLQQLTGTSAWVYISHFEEAKYEMYMVDQPDYYMVCHDIGSPQVLVSLTAINNKNTHALK